ncbi:SRPBCC family protein [Amycolatopsis silviterrae]|uniref:SRPBCC family protein n=1 Tax=Amycolatopsis silviterrae TaxID=1656914 RepID=A0ABW5H7X3_9PSEU
MKKTFTTDVRIEIAAAAGQVRAALLDMAAWPSVHRRTVHAEYRERHDREDLVEVWAANGDGLVNSRLIRRKWEPGSSRIEFASETDDARTGRWTVEPQPDGTTLVGMLHEFAVAEEDLPKTGALVTGLERGSRDYLGTLKRAVENRAEIARLTTTVETSQFVAGPAGAVYAFLSRRAADVGPAIEGGAPGPVLARVLLPPNEIAYKQLRLPDSVEAHLGRWTLTEHRDGVLVRASQLVRLAPGDLDAAGIVAAQEKLRVALSAEQADRLRAVKAHVE